MDSKPTKETNKALFVDGYEVFIYYQMNIRPKI